MVMHNAQGEKGGYGKHRPLAEQHTRREQERTARHLFSGMSKCAQKSRYASGMRASFSSCCVTFISVGGSVGVWCPWLIVFDAVDVVDENPE